MDSAARVDYLPRTTCPLVALTPGAHDLRRIASIQTEYHAAPFEVLECGTCGVAVTSPYPTEETVANLYAARDTLGNFDPIHGTVVDRLKDHFAHRDLRTIAARAGGGPVHRVLDFGTGNGWFALAAAQAFPGSSVTAVDFVEAPPEALLAHASVRYIPQARLGDASSFDLIVLRHVHDPVAFLRSFARRLSPTGIVYVEVPNRRSAHLQHFGQRLNALAVPFHLFHFDSRSLDLVMRAAGLRAVIREKEMPQMGVILAGLLGQERALAHQLVGVALHPVQLAAGWLQGKPCLMATCHARSAGDAVG